MQNYGAHPRRTHPHDIVNALDAALGVLHTLVRDVGAAATCLDADSSRRWTIDRDLRALRWCQVGIINIMHFTNLDDLAKLPKVLAALEKLLVTDLRCKADSVHQVFLQHTNVLCGGAWCSVVHMCCTTAYRKVPL